MAYNADSIEIKNFVQACRTTPSMYLGDDGENGIFNCFLEILNNACDEAIMGRGNLIEVWLEDNSIRVSDHGAGIPHGPNKDSKEVLIELFTSAHSSGKFNKTNYKKVRGIHGIGSSAVCVCSEQYEVWTLRDGFSWYLKFINGIPQSEIAERGNPTKETGTIIKFTPNKEVFHLNQEEKCFNYERIREELELTSYFIPNVTFELKYNGKTERFLSRNGLKDFAASRIKNSLHKNYIYGYKEFDDEVEIEVFAQWTTGKEQCYIFSNGALNSEGGTPVTGAKTAFTRTVNSISKNDFDGDMIRKGLVYIVNIRHPNPIYQNQVKNKIQNAELKGYTQTVFTEAIKQFSIENQNDFNKIIEVLSKEKRAEQAADRARQAILTAETSIEKAKKNKIINVQKLADAEVLGENAILLCTEGKSASSNMRKARDPKRYGILQLRGKIINALSNNIEDVLENEEVMLLLKASGISLNNYSSSKLRYGKIGICVDADDDGGHIACLIMALLYRIAPQFLKENRLVWLHAPLYKVIKNNKTYYYYTEEELRNGVKGEQIHFKGLGEMDDRADNKIMFNPETQRMETLTWNSNFEKIIIELMGKDSATKKNFIFNRIDFSKFGGIA